MAQGKMPVQYLLGGSRENRQIPAQEASISEAWSIWTSSSGIVKETYTLSTRHGSPDCVRRGFPARARDVLAAALRRPVLNKECQNRRNGAACLRRQDNPTFTQNLDE